MNMNQVTQSLDEVLRIVDEWVRNFKPSNVIANKKNVTVLVDYTLETYNLVSISYLTEAANALAGKLELVPEIPAPKVPTADELAQQEVLRQNRDYLDSLKPQPDFRERMREVQAKKEAENAKKVQEDAKGQLAVAISGYQCYRVNGGGIDYTATEMVQKELSTVISRVNGKRDFVHNLATVKQIILELPDHPRAGAVARTLESIKARALDASPANKDSFGTDVKKVGKLGGHR